MTTSVNKAFNLEEFTKSAAGFAAKLVNDLAEVGIRDQEHYSKIDHVCYRVDSLESYEKWKQQLAPFSRVLSEAMVNGRPIATLELEEPIIVSQQISIKLLELPAPKPSQSYDEGFEHIECVVKEPLHKFQRKFSEIEFQTNNIAAKVNADISCAFASGVVKFHRQCLSEIIQFEKDLIIKNNYNNIVLFDFDDTLVNSKAIFLECFYDSLCEFIGQKISLEEMKNLARPTFPEFFANLGITNRDMMSEALRVFKTRWQAVSEKVEVPVGIESLLSCLHTEGYKLAIWTARDYGSTLAFIQSRGLDKFFKHIFAYDVGTVSKPDPLEAMLPFIKDARVFMIGDSLSDYAGANNIEASFIQAAWVHKNPLTDISVALAYEPLHCLNFILKAGK